MKAGRYYVSALIEIPDNKTADLSNEGIGTWEKLDKVDEIKKVFGL